MSVITANELAALVPSAQRLIDQHEDWLYFHLTVARAARAQLDRATTWNSHYVAKHRERQNALAQASKHYLRLIDMGAAISPLLAEMVLSEGGLTP